MFLCACVQLCVHWILDLPPAFDGVSILADSKTWLEQAWSNSRFSPTLSRGLDQMIQLKENQRTNLSLEAFGRTWCASALLRPNCVLPLVLSLQDEAVLCLRVGDPVQGQSLKLNYF